MILSFLLYLLQIPEATPTSDVEPELLVGGDVEPELLVGGDEENDRLQACMGRCLRLLLVLEVWATMLVDLGLR